MKKREVGGRSGGEGENTASKLGGGRDGAERGPLPASWERADFCSPGVKETRSSLV